MKTRITVFATVALAALFAVSTDLGQTRTSGSGPQAFLTSAGLQATTPPYLSQFPTVERVKSEIKGADAMDTAARLMGAFWQLRQVIETLAGPRFYRSPTPDEGRLIGQYNYGYQLASQPIEKSLPPGDTPKWYKMHATYETDRAFLDELFKRFLSPTLRDQYFAAKGQANARAQARQNAQTPPLNQPTTTPPNPPAVSAAPKPAPSATRATDPSIAKARAANVDTKVFGIPLGEPLQLPACPDPFANILDIEGMKAAVREAGARTCVMTDVLGLGSLNDFFGIKALTNVKTISLASDSRPTWLEGTSVYGIMHEGLLVGVAILTKGRNVDQAVAKELRLKYGQQPLVKHGVVSPSQGNPFKTNDLVWALPGLHVEYNVALPGESEGQVANVNQGRVRVETEAAYQRRLEKEKEKAKPKM